MCISFIHISHNATRVPSAGTNSPGSLKKILSLSEEASEKHRKLAEDAVSSASSQLSSPPTSPRCSPKKGKDKDTPHYLSHPDSFNIKNCVHCLPLVARINVPFDMQQTSNPFCCSSRGENAKFAQKSQDCFTRAFFYLVLFTNETRI